MSVDASADTAIDIVVGNPSDDELAALIAVLSAATAARITPTPPIGTLGGWGSPTDQLRYGLVTLPAHFVNAHYSR